VLLACGVNGRFSQRRLGVTSQIIFVALGGILILTGVIGGGLEMRELKIPQVKWPTRIFAFIAGFVFVGVGVNLDPDVTHINPVVEAREAPAARETPRPEPVKPTPVSRVEDDAWLRDSLKAAVLKASDAEIRALQSRDPSVLNGVVTGDAYRKIAEILKSLESQNLYAVEQLHDQQFESFSVDPTGQRAEIRVIETWSGAQYSTRTNECVRAYGMHKVPQTVSLERQGDRWIQSDFTTYGGEPVLTRCP